MGNGWGKRIETMKIDAMEIHSFAKYFRKCTFQSTKISSFHFNFLCMQNRYKTQQRLNSKIISKIYSRFVLA